MVVVVVVGEGGGGGGGGSVVAADGSGAWESDWASLALVPIFILVGALLFAGWINDENPVHKAANIAHVSNFQTPIDEVR